MAFGKSRLPSARHHHALAWTECETFLTRLRFATASCCGLAKRSYFARHGFAWRTSALGRGIPEDDWTAQLGDLLHNRFRFRSDVSHVPKDALEPVAAVT